MCVIVCVWNGMRVLFDGTRINIVCNCMCHCVCVSLCMYANNFFLFFKLKKKRASVV